MNIKLLAFQAAASKIDKNIYNDGSDNVNKAIIKIVKYVGGVGAGLLTLAILIIALVIIFASISPKNVGTAWKALFSCLAGALLFYSAYFLAPSIAAIVS
ncbi:TrbC/VirB2 family protein [Viridibacillus arvi]|uniref:TrbC/VirB2 family protein n=1 Tax=Viridibacillus arvi TaxID=263475 RepID=UPI0034CE956A